MVAGAGEETCTYLRGEDAAEKVLFQRSLLRADVCWTETKNLTFKSGSNQDLNESCASEMSDRYGSMESSHWHLDTFIWFVKGATVFSHYSSG